MSTLKVTNIQSPSAGSPSIVLDSSGGMSGAFPSPNRNLLYNGAMQVHQRGTSATGITTGGYSTADRWASAVITLGTWTQDIQNDAPTGSGFRKSLRMLCTTADSTPAAGDFVAVRQILEGQDVQRIAKGTSFAQQLTLSFWVKSNVTGTYIVDLYDNDNNRLVSASYTVIAGATWEKKIITFPIDTVGVFDNDNAASLYVDFFLAAGSNFTSGTLQTTWATYTAANNAVGQTNLAAATNNYWQITGVQLETGAVATSFEFKSYGQELRECQRYYERVCVSVATVSSALVANILAYSPFAVVKRAEPSAPIRITNDYLYGASGMGTSTSTYIVKPEGVGAYRATNGTVAQAQFSELLAISAEL